jgi:hypothetical protein
MLASNLLTPLLQYALRTKTKAVPIPRVSTATSRIELAPLKPKSDGKSPAELALYMNNGRKIDPVETIPITKAMRKPVIVTYLAFGPIVKSGYRDPAPSPA